YLQKPFTPEQLSQRVREVLGRSTTSHTILVVGDHESVLKEVRGILLDAGFAVIDAGNERQAMEKLEKSPHEEVMIADLEHAEENGFTVLQMVRASRPRLKVIVLSSTEGEIQEAADKFAAQATVRKPVEPERLLATVNQVLTQRS